MKSVKTFLLKVGMFHLVTSFYHLLVRAIRALYGVDRRIINNYLEYPGNKKIQIGCGDHHLDNWLNSDIYPKRNEVYINALKLFPLPDCMFNYVYSEHMIEHIEYQECLKMLSECFRILKPGGKLRVSTPDLKFLVELYNENKSEIQISYLQWAVGKSIKDVNIFGDAFLINRFMHRWGHTFIYDHKTLKSALEQTGFVNVERLKVGQSNDPELRGLEFVDRLPAGFIELESLVLEATKPQKFPAE